MIIFLVLLLFICIYNIEYSCGRDQYFKTTDTNALRGIFSIVVVLVHVPANYQNIIQDTIGSFAYIGVTYFFLVSSYGLKYNYIKRENYLKSFWQKRILKLMIPMILINCVFIIFEALKGNNILSARTIFYINDWVAVLMLFYFAFWVLYSIPASNNREGWCWQDVVICVFVVVCSLIDKVTTIKIVGIWPTECMGFVWGILLYNFIESFKKYMDNKWIRKCSVLVVLAMSMGIAYLKFKPVQFWGDYCLKILLGIVLLLLVIGLMVRIDISNKFNLFLGGISYEIYLLHIRIFDIVEDIGGDRLESHVFIWISVIATVVLAIGINKLSNVIYKGLNDAWRNNVQKNK